MKNILVATTLLSASLLLLSACGSSSNTSYTPTTPNTTLPMTGTAFYVDSAVGGVDVLCGTTHSVTDTNGAFIYEEGQDCQFYIGDVLLRHESGLYDGKVVIEDNLQTAQFLQSMDYDGDATNGISIHNQTGDILAQHNIHTVPHNDDTLAESVTHLQNANIGYHGDFVHQNDAQEHLNNTQQQHNTQQHNQNDSDKHR
jgi:hypothetical protein